MPPAIKQRSRNILSRNNDTPPPDSLLKEDGPSKQDERPTSTSPNISVSYTNALDVSFPERLWDQAYDALKIQDAALVQVYEKILSRYLRGQGFNSPVTDSDENVIAQDNAHTRRTQMRRLIDEGLHNTAREAKLKETISTATPFIFAAKDIICSAIQIAPQAALAWAGVCVALEVIDFTIDTYSTPTMVTIVIFIDTLIFPATSATSANLLAHDSESNSFHRGQS